MMGIVARMSVLLRRRRRDCDRSCSDGHRFRAELNHGAAHSTGLVARVEILPRIRLEALVALRVAEIVLGAFVFVAAASSSYRVYHHPANRIFYASRLR